MSTVTEYTINIGELHALRGRLITILKRDVSWQEIAELADLSQNTLSNILNGRSKGSQDTIASLIQAFGAQGVPATYEQLLTQ